METYTGFAQVYDTFMDHVPYDEWVDYLQDLLKEEGIQKGIVLELGCGTGNVTRRLHSLGYDMIGIDNSIEMLELARRNDEILIDRNSHKNHEKEILYLHQDMREFELFGSVSAIISICDSMNYITSSQELLQIFRLVNNYLDPRGVFIFDLNTEYKYKHVLGDQVFAEDRNDCSFIWNNYYYEEEKINEYELSIFVKQRDKIHHCLYNKLKETHYQKAYSIDTIISLIEEAGLEFVTAYDSFTHNAPTKSSERVHFIAREKYQEGKIYTKKNKRNEII